MAKYGRPVVHGNDDDEAETTRMIDVIELPSPLPDWAKTEAAFLDKIFEHNKAGWVAAGEWFVRVPDAVMPSASYNGGDHADPASYQNVPDRVKGPNNPDNPYFGKQPMATDLFWAFVGQVLGADRFKRLFNDGHFLALRESIRKTDVIDPDDMGGRFLAALKELTGTNGDDGKLLMEQAEVDAIMKAWE